MLYINNNHVQKEPWSHRGVSQFSHDDDVLPAELLTLSLIASVHMA